MTWQISGDWRLADGTVIASGAGRVTHPSVVFKFTEEYPISINLDGTLSPDAFIRLRIGDKTLAVRQSTGRYSTTISGVEGQGFAIDVPRGSFTGEIELPTAPVFTFTQPIARSRPVGVLAEFDDVLNDLILIATGGPTVNEGLVSHYQANGATSSNLQQAEYEFLVAASAAPENINDMWFKLLTGAGYAGAMNDMLKEFWGAGGTFGPPAAVDMNQLGAYMTSEGWTVLNQTNNSFQIQSTGDTILRANMQACNFAGLFGPLENDLRDGLAAQGKVCP